MGLEEGPFVFRVNDNGSGPNLLIQVCLERGWREFRDDNPSSNNWNLWWKTQAFPVSHQKPLLSWQVCMERGWREYTESSPIKDGWNLWWKTTAFSVSQHKNLKAWQFTNHIPKGATICRKDNLARNLKCMKKVYGTIYDISPLGYNLPLEYTKLVADCSRHEEDDDDGQKVWICKPVGQSQGRGIFLFKSLSDLCYDSNAVVQRYIKNPLLIGGYKFDLRLYVCVPSYHPLTIYLYKEGLVRFSTDKFSLSDLNNPFCHLTNSSLNKLGPGYAEQKDRIGAGCKWSFKQLRQYFKQAGIRDWLLWQKVSALVTLTILSQSTSIPQTTNCFEFYGFDVLIDDKLKPWLLEVNLSPALGNDCDIDPVVKKPLLHDLFDLLGLPVCNTGLSAFTVLMPFDGRSPLSSSRSEIEEINDSDKASKNKQKTSPKTKSIPVGMNSQIKTTSSAIIAAAAAATKWKRRKSCYLFGPPNRKSIDYNQIKAERENTTIDTNSAISVVNAPILSQKKEDKKSTEKIPDQSRKSAVGGKRSREKDLEKVKPSNSAVITRGKAKSDLQLSKTVSLLNTSKAVKVETNVGDSMNKKKKIFEALEPKHVKCRNENKSIYAYDKQRKLYPDQTDPKTKTIVFPYDKSFAMGRGFKGRTKSHLPVLWGNGRDWGSPINKEGDWSRIYPFSNFNNKYNPTFEEDYMGNKFSIGDKQIRLVVHNVSDFMKVCKQIYCKGVHLTEEELNSQLINHLGITGDVWLPSK